MLRIQKRNLSEQMCFCCHGEDHWRCDPDSSIEYKMYRALPGGEKHLEVTVVVPRCVHCASLTRPVWYVSTFFGLLAAVMAVMKFGVLGLCLGVMAFALVYYAAKNAFAFVYRQDVSKYEIVKVMTDRYGWTSSEPVKGALSTFTQKDLEVMMWDLAHNHDCECK